MEYYVTKYPRKWRNGPTEIKCLGQGGGPPMGVPKDLYVVYEDASHVRSCLRAMMQALFAVYKIWSDLNHAP
jgi:hypothetical protein